MNISFTLSRAAPPPSHQANCRKGRWGIFKTQKLKDFEEEVKWHALEALNKSGITPPKEIPIKASFTFGYPSVKALDIDNAIKSVSDCIQGILIDDDYYIIELHGYRIKSAPKIYTIGIEIEYLT